MTHTPAARAAGVVNRKALVNLAGMTPARLAASNSTFELAIACAKLKYGELVESNPIGIDKNVCQRVNSRVRAAEQGSEPRGHMKLTEAKVRDLTFLAHAKRQSIRSDVIYSGLGNAKHLTVPGHLDQARSVKPNAYGRDLDQLSPLRHLSIRRDTGLTEPFKEPRLW
jgi:hypothetical protein